MIKIKEYDVNDTEALCRIGKALSSPVRVEMLQLLNEESLIIGEVAKKMNLPASSAAFHLKILEEAKLIRVEEQPGTRGNTKLCSRRVDRLNINLYQIPRGTAEIYTVEMPVGAFTDCQVQPTCGLGDVNGFIINEDQVENMFLPERLQAGIVWGSAGYVEYRFPNGVPYGMKPGMLRLTAELCSEAPGYRNDWMSDITLWVNGKDCGTWVSPGDFGDRRGRLTPSTWPNGATQYGRQVMWEINGQGCFVNGNLDGNTKVCLEDIHLMDASFLTVRIGIKPDAEHSGGFTLFGKNFGDYNEDIILTIEY